jgi:hypothetical protein
MAQAQVSPNWAQLFSEAENYKKSEGDELDQQALNSLLGAIKSTGSIADRLALGSKLRSAQPNPKHSGHVYAFYQALITLVKKSEYPQRMYERAIESLARVLLRCFAVWLN